ncbi:hypothetical protein [Shewanella sp. OMA3-2]|uniref:hypothetical protein n=1 Tax=Shewanella sp. OMA3-2 TaxID=2908650 RepID=UPI001F218888|nr:hypothetical protein [Shewanella sp. OMA3-2]UJF22687.1 hypothetical protein L0B17_04620 [Shewanella sp. OMA3-2]
MAAMSFLSVIARYHEHESVIHELLDSIILGLSDASIFHHPTSDKVFTGLAKSYPFVQLLYLLDKNGTQVSDNLVVSQGKVKLSAKGRDTDRSHRPYFTGLAEQDSSRYITSPYYRLLAQPAQNDPLLLFGIIIFLILALAIFDLGKTILEEEVLMHKDIFRHSSTRRTITCFISTILIAISIEALLTMFKASLGEEQLLTQNQQQKFNRLS